MKKYLIIPILLLAAFCFAPKAHAAILLVQTSTKLDANGGASGTLVFTSSITTGDLVVVGCGAFPGPVTAISDAKGNGWNFYPTSTYQSNLWYAANVTGGFTTTTVTFGAASSHDCLGLEFSGAAVAPADASGTASGTGTTGTSKSLTPSVSGDVFVAINTVNNTPAQTLKTANWNNVGWASGSYGAVGFAYFISSDASAHNASWTWSGSQAWGAEDAAFKAAASNPVAGPPNTSTILAIRGAFNIKAALNIK